MNCMDFKRIIKLPAGFEAPKALTYKDLRAEPLARKHLAEDLAAVNSSLSIIRKTRGGSWPEGELDEEFNILDLAWHEREFRDATSFAYVIHNEEGTYIGCVYLYPMGERTPLREDLLEYEVDASWWVTADAYDQGHYEKLYEAILEWMGEAFPFENVHYSNTVIPS